MTKRLLTIAEAALILKCSRRTTYRLLSEGLLEGCKIRGGTRVTERSVNAYIDAQVLSFQLENGEYQPLAK